MSTAPTVIEVRPNARINARVFVECALRDCHTVAKTQGLCNSHYMEHYRETLAVLQDEVSNTIQENGEAEEYFCEDPECDSAASKWYVKNGTTPTALCMDHVGARIESIRLNLRRLELKR